MCVGYVVGVWVVIAGRILVQNDECVYRGLVILDKGYMCVVLETLILMMVL